MIDQIVSNLVVSQARTWLGTRFHHQGRLKKSRYHPGGCDCLGLVLGVAKELELKVQCGNQYIRLDALDNRNYGRVPNGKILKQKLDSILIPISSYAPGSILLFHFNNNPQHLGIATDIGMIHCYAEIGKVVEHQMDNIWLNRLVSAYQFDGEM